MIQLNPDCVMVELENGKALPCSVELLTVEMLGEKASWMDPEILQNICEAVMLYLRDELGKGSVPFHEFAQVLKDVLRGFGFEVCIPKKSHPSLPVRKTDLADWLGRQELGFDLMLFQRLREELTERLLEEPAGVLWIHGTHNCVKAHLGARRWSRKCQQLNDQLVAFIRECFDREANAGSSLIVHA